MVSTRPRTGIPSTDERTPAPVSNRGASHGFFRFENAQKVQHDQKVELIDLRCYLFFSLS